MKVGKAYNQSKAGHAPDGHLFTAAIFFCPQCGCIGEVRLYRFFFTFLQEVLFSIPSKSVIGWTSLSQRYLHCQKNYDYRKQSAWFFPLEMYSYSFLRVLCNTHCFSDYSIKVFYGSGECLVLNIPTSDSDDIPEIVRRLEEISIGCQVKLFFCVSSLYIGKHCPVKSNYSLPAQQAQKGEGKGEGEKIPYPLSPTPLPISLSRNPLTLSAPAVRAKLPGELSWQSVCLLSVNESRGNQPMTFRIIFLTGN